MVHTFLGLNAQEWAESDGLPLSPWTETRLTVEEIRLAIVAMLRRQDEPGEAWVCEECREPWVRGQQRCAKCGNRTRVAEPDPESALDLRARNAELESYCDGVKDQYDRAVAVADVLAERLRSAYAVIERMKAAQFNPAILNRIHEALDEHRDVLGIKGVDR